LRHARRARLVNDGGLALHLGIAFLIVFVIAQGQSGNKAMMPLAPFGFTSFVGLRR
jgi:hypothetical protein